MPAHRFTVEGCPHRHRPVDGVLYCCHNTRNMPDIVLLILVIRAIAIGQVLLVALVIFRSKAPRRVRIVTAVLLVCACCYLVLQTPMFFLLQGPLRPLVPLGAQLVPLFLWIFAHLLFERTPNPRLMIAGGLLATACWATLNFGNRIEAIAFGSTFYVAATVQRLSQMALLLHAMQVAVAERGDDLIEARRRLRVGFVIAVAALSVMVILFEFFYGFDNMPQPALLVQALIILVVTFALGAALLQSNIELFADPAKPKAEPRFSPAEHVLNQKLEAAMASGVYREPGLTIGVLAGKLGVPEHRLRALINQRLGYRNFSAFLNEHRITEARTLLASHEHVALPILTIAMDLGYGSLAPFNRAFRDAQGQAPSEFRRAAILPE